MSTLPSPDRPSAEMSTLPSPDKPSTGMSTIPAPDSLSAGMSQLPAPNSLSTERSQLPAPDKPTNGSGITRINLCGKTIAVTGERRITELANLVARHGGQPLLVPTIQTCPVEERHALLDLIHRTVAGEIAYSFFVTGVGARAVIGAAEAIGLKERYLSALSKTFIVARGPKARGALARAGITPTATAAEHTSPGMLATLDGHDLCGKIVAIQVAGESNPFLHEHLAARGATVIELQVYSYSLPEDRAPVEQFFRALFADQVDAVTFTSPPAVMNLFQLAEADRLVEQVRHALNTQTIVTSVGTTTGGALEELGVTPDVIPTHETMSGMLSALSEYLRQGIKNHKDTKSTKDEH